MKICLIWIYLKYLFSQELSSEQLGFDLCDEVPAEMSPEDEKDVSKVWTL